MSLIPFSSGNHVRLLHSGEAFFSALLQAIATAQAEIRLETYIFATDATGQKIADALSAAAQRGINVHVMVDGFGSPDFMPGLGEQMRRAGVEVMIYRPELARFRMRKQRLRRLHRKLACIDAGVGFIGGINIIDDLDDAGRPRLDYTVRVEGPVVAPIHHTMTRLWELVRWASLGRRYRAAPPRQITTASEGQMHAALLVRDNLRHRRSIENAYLDAMQNAQNEILIANAYFLPGRRFRQALIDAAQRGVNVTLLLEGKVEYRLQYFATLALYEQMLSAGVNIYEYRHSFLHAKVAVIDDDWATVGSSNIDPFSLLLAREANLVVRDKAFASSLRADLTHAIATGGVKIEGWVKLPWYYRLAAWLAYGTVRTLIGLAGYSKLH